MKTEDRPATIVVASDRPLALTALSHARLTGLSATDTPVAIIELEED